MLIITAALAGMVSIAQDNREPRQPRNDKKAEKRQQQNNILKHEEEEGEIIFRTHKVFGIKINTDGYGIMYERGKYVSPRKTNLLQFELNEKLSNREEKATISFDAFGNATQYKFAKANNFYQLKAGYGQQYTIGGKANKNGVAVTALYAGGISIGLIKPYYIDVENGVTRERVRTTFTDTAITKYGILSASGFTVGWRDLKLSPGLHAKTALRFDYGRFNETVTAIEAGVNAEFYSKQILLMGFSDLYKYEKQFFFNAYITIEFGRRR